MERDGESGREGEGARREEKGRERKREQQRERTSSDHSWPALLAEQQAQLLSLPSSSSSIS